MSPFLRAAVTAGLVLSGGAAVAALAPIGSGDAEWAPSEAPGPLAQQARPQAHETSGRFPFYWTRGVYSDYRGGYGYGYGWGRGGNSWATDYPKSDRQFVTVLKRLVRLNVSDWENAIELDNPDLRRFPVLYMVEVGRMDLTDEEVEGLRSYLDAGGFLIVDDFWGMREWQVFVENFRRVYPGKAIVELPLEHPLFSAYYKIDEVKQVPARGRGIRGRPTTECGGCEATVRGVFDDDGRLMVIINWNTDLGDAWEWAEDPIYP